MPPQKPKIPLRTYPLRPSPHSPPEVVDPIWLLKALAISFVAALLCGYATLCLLFYQGEWQLVLHPTHTIDRTPASVGLTYNDIHFDSTETGQPRLTAWWIPSTPQPGFPSRYATPTILYLHDASGSLSDTLPTLTLLHTAGANIFAIDYRGFGSSDSSQHPSESRMAEDATAALDYLTSTRHVPVSSIIPYGSGLAASLAANLAHTHPTVPAVILDNPIPDPAAIAIAARPSHVIPVRLLFGNQFDIATPLASLTTPKLLISGGPTTPTPNPDPATLRSLFTHTASPHITLTLPVNTDHPYLESLSQFHESLLQFFDQYLPPR